LTVAGHLDTSHGRITTTVTRAVSHTSAHRWTDGENRDALTATRSCEVTLAEAQFRDFTPYKGTYTPPAGGGGADGGRGAGQGAGGEGERTEQAHDPVSSHGPAVKPLAARRRQGRGRRVARNRRVSARRAGPRRRRRPRTRCRPGGRSPRRW
ncbi:hypothetical protein EF912_22785, partial [Streptomyces sp. WAC07061]